VPLATETGGRLGRRGFVAGLAASAAGLMLVAGCGFIPGTPRVTKVSRVGFISSDPPDAPWHAALWDGLRERGWEDGRNVTIERRLGGTEGDPAPVVELLTMGLDVLVTVGTPSTLAAKQATSTLPIVFMNVRDPVGVGLVGSLARPGGNVTGVSQGASTQLGAKRVELLRTMVPGLTKLASIQDAANPAVNALGFADIQKAADVLDVQVQALEVHTPDELATILANAAHWPAGGLIVAQSGLFFKERARIAELAAGMHLPAIYYATEFVEAGGLMSYGTTQRSTYQRAAVYVDKVLRGTDTAELPIEQLTTVDFAVNANAAQVLGISIPATVAAQVTQWV
jgi:putative ABC transport system substrate-binding protein